MSNQPEIGSKWVSRDPRDDGRTITVESVDASFAYIRGRAGRRSRVRLPLSRLYRPLEKP